MKTSFYFLLWILIYPIMGLFHSEFISNHSFFVALVSVYGLTWLINRSMPNTLLYEKVCSMAPTLEEVYSCNVKAFKKRVAKDAVISVVSCFYFIAAVLTSLAMMIVTLDDEWLPLVVFGFLLYINVMHATRLVNAYLSLKSDPTSENCLTIVEKVYGLNYTLYYEARENATYEDAFPPRPKYYRLFLVSSFIIACIVSLLGVLMIAGSIFVMMSQNQMALVALAGTSFLYGGLAMFYGLKDIIGVVKTFKGVGKMESQSLLTEV